MHENEEGSGHTMFETALGWIGLGWTRQGVSHVQLPERTAEATRKRLLARGACSDLAETPAEIRSVIDLLSRYCAGEKIDFSRVSVARSGFDDVRAQIYERLRTLPYGETMTYGALAAAIGRPGEAREIGAAMGANPVPIIVPCHRVVAAGGKLGGFSAPGGANTKRRLLLMERAAAPADQNQTAFAF